MNRRETITLLGSATAWPVAARAQAMPVIGFLNGVSATEYEPYLKAFHQGLREMGFVEGQNVLIEYRWADRQYDRLPALAADLVGRRVNVIVAAGTPLAAIAAKAATTVTPIVFNIGSDPTEIGLVESLNRPGGNATGTNMLVTELSPKRLGLLHELVPQARTIAYLANPGGLSQAGAREVMGAAQALGLRIQAVGARTEQDFDQAFALMAQEQAGALLVSPDPTYLNQHQRLVALAADHRLPAIYSYREFPLAGGLISYGTSVSDTYRQLGVYAGRILKGEKPGDLPVLQPTKFDLVINLKTAKALGLTVPASLLAIADEVIE
jgi:putative ABC transport system substrate-binding protein